ncbi:MAG TPA: decaprenyl-phosphate phosphoribosyltransferase [Acidobacteria bacterium]|jgi:4-hydroxybenzoate polyprenyltransferase|nr:decaprenyl-phosphate phosphoribosyltransferase [Acidobacteriota bacterium]
MAHVTTKYDQTGVSPTRETPVPSLWADLLVSLRPDQWTKNLFVFAGLVFGEQLLEPGAVARSCATFTIFCALSSAMYLFNDLRDRTRDRLHPTKALRPIAAGRVSPSAAGTMAGLLLGVGILGAFLLGPAMGVLSLAFAVLLTLYTWTLKEVVVLDVIAIAIGFVMRAVAGALVLGVAISQWLLVCTFLLALFLGLTKRRQEVVALGADATGHRPVLARYSAALLDQMVTIVAGATLVSYAVYTTSPGTVAEFGTDRLTLTIPFPVYGVLRYLMLIHNDSSGPGPTDILLGDRPLAVCIVGWGLAVAVIIYRPFG